MDDKRRDILLAGLCVCMVALLGLSLWQGKQIDALSAQAARDRSSLSSELDRLGTNWYGQMQGLMEDAQSKVSSFQATPAGVDLGARGILLDARLVPKEWRAGMAVTLIQMDPEGREVRRSPLEDDGSHGFEQRLTLRQEDMDAYFEVELDSGGVISRERLDYWLYMRAVVPGLGGWSYSGDPETWHRNEDGTGTLTLRDGLECDLTDGEGRDVTLTDPEYRVYRNGTQIAAVPARTDSVNFGYAPQRWETADRTFPAAEGDEFLLTFAATDGAGVRFEDAFGLWRLTEEGILEEGIDEGFPRILWDEMG